MKKMTMCPRCTKAFAADAKDGIEQETVTCPNCGYMINTKEKVKSKQHCHDVSLNGVDECAWEERGEKRKTILTSMKPRTDRPMFASLLLAAVVIIGISSAVFPEAYLQAPLDVLFAAGLSGTITITIYNQSGIPLENMVVWIDSSLKKMTNSTGSTIIDNVPLGKQYLHVSSSNESAGELKELFFLPIHSSSDITVTNQSGELRITNQSTNIVWCSSIVLLLSIVCMFGFFASWKRQYFDVAFVGSIIGIGTIGFYFIGTILSVIALILLMKSKEEFDNGKKGKSF